MTQLIVRASDILRGCRAAKFTKPRKILQNSVEILSNTCLYNIFETSQLLGLFTCRKLVNLSWNFITETCKQCPETTCTSRRLCCEKLGTSHDALPLVQFWSVLLLKEQMMTSVRKTLKTLVNGLCKTDQSLTTFSLKITTKWSLFTDRPFFTGRFFHEFAPTNPAKFDFFPGLIRSPA